MCRVANVVRFACSCFDFLSFDYSGLEVLSHVVTQRGRSINGNQWNTTEKHPHGIQWKPKPLTSKCQLTKGPTQTGPSAIQTGPSSIEHTALLGVEGLRDASEVLGMIGRIPRAILGEVENLVSQDWPGPSRAQAAQTQNAKRISRASVHF